jgi:hypothetical protein
MRISIPPPARALLVKKTKLHVVVARGRAFLMSFMLDML